MTRDAALARWEGRTIDDLRRRWRLPHLVALPETGSTNDVARALADAGAPAGLLVLTDYQHAGRGRMGRTWSAAPGHALLLSFLLRPARTARAVAPGAAPVRVGLAVARALRAATGIDARLKWPNDLVVRGAGKLAGILCEAATAGGDTIVIAGIGINVAQQQDDWPEALRGTATSIALAMGTPPDRTAVMDALCTAMEPLFIAPLTPLTVAEIRAYETVDALRGRVIAIAGADIERGTARGIASDGALLVETDRGLRRITSATVRPVADHASSNTPSHP
ncbi:MAG TPA: biotin--[acetyl-CoA-carboxylase] ligase [Longimicrobiales bacterium]